MKKENEEDEKTENSNKREKKALKTEYNELDRSNIGDIELKEDTLKKENIDLEEFLENNQKELIKNYDQKMYDLQK